MNRAARQQMATCSIQSCRLSSSADIPALERESEGLLAEIIGLTEGGGTHNEADG